MYDQEAKTLAIDWEDEIVKGMLLTRDGEVVHPAFTG
jgi:NAD(P) transhydrogenase subunit alpha